MRAALTAALIAFHPLPAVADGPALAHLTIDGTTITLTHVDAAQSDLTFAQMHLGFPLPPILHLLLAATPDGPMAVQTIRLNGTIGGSNGAGTHLGPETFLLFEPHRATVTGNAEAFVVDIPALSRAPLGQFAPLLIQINVQMTSP